MTTAERLRREGREEGDKKARSDVLVRLLTTAIACVGCGASAVAMAGDDGTRP